MTENNSVSPLDVDYIMTNLYHRRTVFCSVADFQHEFAKEIRNTYRCQVRCDCPVTVNGEVAHIDIFVVKEDVGLGKVYACPIQIKFKTREETAFDHGNDSLGMVYNLKNDADQNDTAYSYIYDIYKLESLKDSGTILVNANGVETKEVSISKHYSGGVFCHAIFLTSDQKYPNILDNTEKEYKNSNGGSIGNSSDSTLKVGSYKFKWNTYPVNNNRIYLGYVPAEDGPIWQLVDRETEDPNEIPHGFVYVNTVI